MIKRKQTNNYEFIGRFLSHIRYRNKKDPFADFIKLRNQENFPEVQNGTILLLPFRVAPVSNLFEGILGYAFRLKGYKVVSLMCGKLLSYCDNIACFQKKFLSCPLCLYEQNRFCSTFALEEAWFNDLLSEEKQNKLKYLASSVALSDIPEYIYEGVQIGIHVNSAVQRYTLSSEPSIKQNEKLFRGFFLTALITVNAVRDAIRKYQPVTVISSHGVYSTWGTAIETAVTDDQRCVTWGRGYIGGQILATHNASYCQMTTNEQNNLWEDRELTLNQRKKTVDYFHSKRSPKSSMDYITYYKTESEYEEDRLIKKLKLKRSRKRIGLYPNIPWDGQTYKSSDAFPKIESWIQYTIEWFKQNPNVDLIIRAHPAESRRYRGTSKLETFESILRNLYPQLPLNVLFISPETHDISSYAVSRICEAALMYGSTLGLEFAAAGHPVISAGTVWWSNKGILFDAKSAEDYRDLLVKASSGNLKMSDEMKERAIKYAHYWLFNKHMPETIINHKALTYTGYKIKSADELKPGGNETIDWFIDCCLNDKPFNWIEG